MKIMKLILSLFVVISCSLLIYFTANNSAIRKLNAIPLDERKCLELFFRTAFANDGLGYTIFGEKPMTVVSFFDPLASMKRSLIDCSFCSFNAENLRTKKGCELLEKYRSLFCSKTIKIKKCKNFIANDVNCILFINVGVFTKTVDDNLSDFKKILGETITPDLLLERILQTDDVFGEVLKNHQGLIGTLLGYGRNNAWLFHQREEGYFFNGMDSLLALDSFSIKRPRTILTKEEIQEIDHKLSVFDERGILDFNPLLMSLPCFVADQSTAETKGLKSKYQSQYRDIVHRYENRDFLEVTVNQIHPYFFKARFWEQ